jgi:hypothetical protein
MEEVTAAEHAAGRLGDEKLARLSAEFERTGWVVLANVVPAHDTLRELEHSLDLAAAQNLLQGGPTNAARTALGPLLPRGAPWVRAEISANPIAEHLATHLLGGQGFIRWHGSNTALPMPPDAAPLPQEVLEGWAAADGMQHLHMDGWGWSVVTGQRHPTYKIFVNFALSDMSAANGSTQLWPASNHCVPSAGGMPCNVQQIDVETMAPIIQQRAANPATGPLQVAVPRGGAMFRAHCTPPLGECFACTYFSQHAMYCVAGDLRVWHRGMPNYSPHPRHMMGVAYGAVRDPGAETSSLGMGIQDHVFSSSCKSVFQRDAPVMRNINFVDADVDPGGRTQGDEGFALTLDASLGEQLAVLLAERGAEEPPPAWVRMLADGQQLERSATLSRL